MNREHYYQLRHNMRASGWEWNGGSKLTVKDRVFPRPMSTGTPKTESIALVGKTLPTLYDKPYEYDDLIKMFKRLKNERSYIFWKNILRAQVRNDRAIFTEYLTEW